MSSGSNDDSVTSISCPQDVVDLTNDEDVVDISDDEDVVDISDDESRQSSPLHPPPTNQRTYH